MLGNAPHLRVVLNGGFKEVHLRCNNIMQYNFIFYICAGCGRKGFRFLPRLHLQGGVVLFLAQGFSSPRRSRRDVFIGQIFLVEDFTSKKKALWVFFLLFDMLPFLVGECFDSL